MDFEDEGELPPMPKLMLQYTTHSVHETVQKAVIKPTSGERRPLRYGDIMYLTRTFESDNAKFTVNLIGEGLSDKVKVTDFGHYRPNPSNRFSLFRVEPSLSYKNKSTTPSEELTKEKLEEDKDVDRIIMKSAMGNPVSYGDLIQLRHIHSGGYMMLGQRPGVIPGSWDIIIDAEGSERSWIWLLPEDSTKRVGDVIKFTDKIIIWLKEQQMINHICTGIETEQFDHSLPIDEQAGAYAHHHQQSWIISLFEDHTQRNDFLRMGVPISLVNKRTGAYITAKRVGGKDSDEYTVLLSNGEHDYNKFWIFQPVKSFLGGEVTWDTPVVIQNASCRKYLTHEFKLTDKATDHFLLYNTYKAKKTASESIHVQDEVVIFSHTKMVNAKKMQEKSSVLSQLIPVRTRDSTRSEHQNELELANPHQQSKGAIFSIEALTQTDGEVLMKMSHVVPLLTNYSAQLANQSNLNLEEESVYQQRERRYKTSKIRHALMMLRGLLMDKKIPLEEHNQRQSLFIGLRFHKHLIALCQHLVNAYFSEKTEELTRIMSQGHIFDTMSPRNSPPRSQRRERKSSILLAPDDTSRLGSNLSLNENSVLSVQHHNEGNQEPSSQNTSFQHSTNFSVQQSTVHSSGRRKSLLQMTTLSVKNPEIAAQKVLAYATSVLNICALDNEYACIKLSKYIKDLVQILPISVENGLGVENLMVDMFKCLETQVEGETAIFEDFCRQLDTVSDSNIKYQTLLLSLIGVLCESHRSSRSTLHKVLINNIFKSETSQFGILRLEIINCKPCLQFLPKDTSMSYSEFQSNNPRLCDRVKFIDGVQDIKNMIFFFDQLDKPDYVEYVYQALMMINQLCASKDQDVLYFVEIDLNFNSRILYDLATDDWQNLRFKDACLRLYTTMYVCGDQSLNSFMKNRTNDYAFQIEDIRDPAHQYASVINEYTAALNENAADMIRWTLSFWNTENELLMSSRVNKIHKIDFLCSLLYTATSFIDYHQATYLYMRMITSTWLYILAGVMTKTYEDNSHWCIDVLREAREVQEGEKISEQILALKFNDLLKYTSTLLKLYLRFQLHERTESVLYVFIQNRQQLDQQGLRFDIKFLKRLNQQIADINSQKSYQQACKEEMRNQDVTNVDVTQDVTQMMDDSKIHIGEDGVIYSSMAIEQRATFGDIDKMHIFDKNIQIEDFILDFIFSRNTTSRRTQQELVQLAMVTFDIPGHVGKILKKVDVLVSAKLKTYYQQTQALAQKFHPFEMLDNFANVCTPGVGKYAQLHHHVKLILQNLQLRGSTDMNVFRKQQNICRHTGLHIKLMDVFNMYKNFNWTIQQPSMQEFGSDAPSISVVSGTQENGIEIFAYVITALYNFCYKNKENSKEVHHLFLNNAFEPSIFRSADLIQQVSGFKHLKKTDAPQVMRAIIAGYCFQGEAYAHFSNSMRYLLMMMFDKEKDNAPRTDMQNIASRIIIEKLINSGENVQESYPETFSALIEILAYCSKENQAVIDQCQFFFGLPALVQILQSTKRYDVMRCVIHFITFVYFRTGDKLDRGWISEIFHLMSNIVEKARKKLPDLVQMAGFGYYEQVYPKDDPSIVDIIKSTKQKYHEEQQYWRLISSGDSWDKHSGIFKSIRVFLKKCAGTQKYKQSLGLLHSQIDGLKFEINATKSQHGNLVFDTFVKYADKAILKLKKVASNNRNNAPKQTSLLQVGKMIDQDATSKFRRSTTRKSTVHQRKNFEIEAEAVSRSPPKMPRIFGPKIVPSDDCGSTNISSSDHNSDGGISTSLTKFIQAFQKQFRGQSFLEKFDEHPAKSIIYEQIKNGGPQDQLYFNKSCELFKSFSERTILFKLLKKSIKAAETEKQQQKITQAYFKCGIFEMAVTSLIQRKDNNEELAAIRLLNQMIEKPAPRFQIKLLNWLSESNKYYKLFLFIQEEIEESKERILAKYAAEWKKDEGSMVAVLDLILPGALDEFRDNNFATRTKSIKIHLNVVRFMQLWCDNCCNSFQSFMRCQNSESSERSNIDLVSTMQRYIIDLSQTYNFILISSETRNAIVNSIEALIDFVTGPCEQNQKLLGTNPKLLKYFAAIIEEMAKRLFDDTQKMGNQEYVYVQKQAILFLMTLVEGNPDPKVLKCMRKYLKLQSMIDYVIEVYDKLIKGRESLVDSSIIKKQADHDKALDLETAYKRSFITQLEKEIIENAVQIVILLMKIKKLKSRLKNSPAYIKYYTVNIGYVEILKDNRIEAHYFKIPQRCRLLSAKSISYHIESNDQSSHQKKLEEFVNKSKLADCEMKHQQNIYPYRRFSRSWTDFGIAQFLVIVAINVFIIITEPSAEYMNGDKDADYDNFQWHLFALGIAQTVWMLLSFTFYNLEHYPLIVYSHLLDQDQYEYAYYFKQKENASVKLFDEYKKIGNKTGFDSKHGQQDYPIQTKLYYLLCTQNSFYHLGYLALSLFALYYPFLYGILLVDVFKRSSALQNILSAITTNRWQLFYCLLLTVVSVYIFSIFGFIKFSDYYVNSDPDVQTGRKSDFFTSWETILDCFISTFNVGIRLGGGIGEGIGKVDPTDDDYASRIVFDVLFFMVIIIILLNIFFGIIIDTFAQLRDQKRERWEQLNTKCFICGLERSQIELHSKGWTHHFMNSHSPMAYLAFIIFVRDKPTEDCSGLEKYVKECIEKKDIVFFPNSSKELVKKGVVRNDD